MVILREYLTGFTDASSHGEKMLNPPRADSKNSLMRRHQARYPEFQSVLSISSFETIVRLKAGSKAGSRDLDFAVRIFIST